jgi:hypothetical protein
LSLENHFCRIGNFTSFRKKGNRVSGFGDLVMHLTKELLETSFVGIEVAPLPWFVSVLYQWIQRSQAQFIGGITTTLTLKRPMQAPDNDE